MALGTRCNAQEAFLAKMSINETVTPSQEPLPGNATQSTLEARALSSRWGLPSNPCDVNEMLRRGASASFNIYNKFHGEYLSSDTSNVDLWHHTGSHAKWHLKHAAGHTANRFYLVNDQADAYLSSSDAGSRVGGLANVELWGGRSGRGRNDDYVSHRELQWLVFTADEITSGAPKCTFYIMHSDSHKWLDTHGDNVHLWGDSSDIFEMGSAPENMQWEFRPARS